MSAQTVETYRFDDDGSIPNNPELPVLVYEDAVPEAERPEPFFRGRLAENDWSGTWVNGVFNYHHYHSTAHEFLGVLRGEATLALGGPEGIELEVGPGDALVLPAGMGHCNLGQSRGFSVLGAYPRGQNWDLRRGEPEDRPEVLENIPEVGLPSGDPIVVEGGPLVEYWF